MKNIVDSVKKESKSANPAGATLSKPDKPYKSVFPGKYIQGEGLIAGLAEMMKSFGNKGLIIPSHTAKEKILKRYTNDFAENEILLEDFIGECCEKELKRLQDIGISRKINVIAGVGGGKAIDTAKIVADRAGVPVIIVPTIASNDAPTSSCAVIYSEDGIFESIYYQKMNPQVVLVDVEVIVNAPARFLVAGMGDALATWFEARSCERTHSMNECGGYSTMAGLNLAKLCYNTLLKYGLAARMACENKIITPALHHIVEANILLSGIGFESGGLATAHSIHNGLSALDETHAYYHGEKVAFGVLTGLHLTDASPAEMETVYAFCEKVGLPTTLSDVGLVKTDRNMLMKAAVKACEPQEGIHHEAGRITPEKVLYAMIAADTMGKKQKNKITKNMSLIASLLAR